MSHKQLTELRALLDEILPEWKDASSSEVSADQFIDEEYAEQLTKMTKAQLTSHLRSLEGLHLYGVYCFLSTVALCGPDPTRSPLRIVKECIFPSTIFRNHTLADVCLRFLGSADALHRMEGAGSIGTWLGGTHHKRASHALALIVRNVDETDQMRRLAYSSLQLINDKVTSMDSLRQEQKPPSEILSAIDWSLVDSCLYGTSCTF